MTEASALHYCDVIMGANASQITSLTAVYSTVYSGADRRKHKSSASLAFARGIHRGPVNSPHKRPVTRKMFPFDDVIMNICLYHSCEITNWVTYLQTATFLRYHDMETRETVAQTIELTIVRYTMMLMSHNCKI